MVWGEEEQPQTGHQTLSVCRLGHLRGTPTAEPPPGPSCCLGHITTSRDPGHFGCPGPSLHEDMLKIQFYNCIGMTVTRAAFIIVCSLSYLFLLL